MEKIRYYILTIPHYAYTPFLHTSCNYVRGQLEQGASGYLHWQMVVFLKSPQRRSFVKKLYGDEAHIEPTRSAAAMEYVWKQETSVPNTQFELGSLPTSRCSSKDWDAIRSSAVEGRMESIPSDVYIRCYNSLKRIAVDHSKPVCIERKIIVYYGPTGTGKSRRAWDEAGFDAYPKDPNTKFWDGYNGHKNVVIDEFRGIINISNVLRWFDRYPVLVEVKGSSAVFKAENIWITSNLHPDDWYPELDPATKLALKRRLLIVNIL
ncbi:replication associated protein [Lake Sarah-associated circular virus-44]|uniref:Replication-associated protein n=1 Tax=Lake Sarah-associated circular virus-44 TaxID=1685773 RepID=A0A140AQQ9_9VIRU|nr:replication associated protein [Lake Sarah-associated circular virus-44]ALE29793.1 replication associated protein [Lake Sarah-associated circular virus-44]